MFGDDEESRPKPPTLARPLDGMGVGELEAYIAQLRVEIDRVEAEIARKRAIRDAALNVFKS